MVAPMFDKVPGQDEDEDEAADKGDAKDGGQSKKRCFCCKAKPIEAEEEKYKTDPKSAKTRLKTFVLMENYVDFVKLISATFLFKGGVYGTIVCDSLACLALLVFTLKWTFDNLQQYGLTQNEPGFPFGVSLIRALGFFASIVGCLVEVLKITHVIDSKLDFLLLFAAISVSSLGVLFLLCKYHTKFNRFDDDVDVHLLLKYNYDAKKIELIHGGEDAEHRFVE